MTRTPEPIVVTVRIPAPRLGPQWLVRRKMRATLDTYSHIPGLTFKIFAIEKGRAVTLGASTTGMTVR